MFDSSTLMISFFSLFSMNSSIVNIVKHWYCFNFSWNFDILIHESFRILFELYLTKRATNSHSSSCSHFFINAFWSNLEFVINKLCTHTVCRYKHIDSLTRFSRFHRSIQSHFRILSRFCRLSLMHARLESLSTWNEILTWDRSHAKLIQDRHYSQKRLKWFVSNLHRFRHYRAHHDVDVVSNLTSANHDQSLRSMNFHSLICAFSKIENLWLSQQNFAWWATLKKRMKKEIDCY